MPPKAKYTKEQIADVAFSMVRKSGMSVLSARSLATKLGTSTAPIFTAFQGIEEVENAVLDKAKSLYKSYIQDGLKQVPPFKGAGLKYIQFAKDEPQLFKLLCMGPGKSNVVTHFMPANDENAPDVQNALQSFWGITFEEAKSIYNHLSVYAHGLAVLFAEGSCVYTMQDVSEMLTEMFMALKNSKIDKKEG